MMPVSLYKGLDHNIPPRITRRLDRAMEQGKDSRTVQIYFRADDGGVPGRNWSRLINLFTSYRVPLNIALVPAWLTPSRWAAIQQETNKATSLYCWHQHGWRHVNHEPEGKKQEFGPSRTKAAIDQDLTQGMKKLDGILGKDFYPVFTPPWNRCSKQTIHFLEALGYKAWSGDSVGKVPKESAMAEIPVHVDLHTLKYKSVAAGWDALFYHLTSALKTGQCGIMIHHMKMDEGAFAFLDLLLKIITSKQWMRPVRFQDLESY